MSKSLNLDDFQRYRGRRLSRFYEVTGDDANDTIAISVNQTNSTFTLDNQTYTVLNTSR